MEKIETNDKLTYQLTYNGYIVVLELYANEGTNPYSPIMIGYPHQNGYGFTAAVTLPSVMDGVYERIGD